MISELFNTMHKARFSGIRIVPENSPSLQASCVRAFVESVVEAKDCNERIVQLQFLPASLLTATLDRMCRYPQLRPLLRAELTDPVQFMKLFNGYAPDYGTLEKCLREAALSGRPQVLKDLASNYCDMLRAELRKENAPSHIRARVLESLKFGDYLYEAGWCRCGADVLSLTQELISPLAVQQGQLPRPHLELECLVQLLRAQIGACLTSKAAGTVEKLLTFVDASSQRTGGPDSGSPLVKAYLQLGSYYYHVQDYDRCHFWALRALTAVGGESAESSTGDVIDVLQLIALFCIAKERHDLGNMLISQAVRRARTEYGSLHRRYADVLQQYGFVLLRTNAILPAITAFTECLDITGRVYGMLSPHAVVLEGYLAHCLYLRSHTTGRFDMALRHAEAALDLAHQLMPGSRQVRQQLERTRDLILRGPDSRRSTKECQPPRERDYGAFSLHEIKEKFFELDSSFERDGLACSG
ncbi:amyloid protein-binding protein 2 [Anopheles ziemanni]|uniref:amyloid protein-binding protein 2 n=1 Tax=Anopheles coustani TaxID=139045 RepID=UPI002657AD6D|nr:amyloid protein-binding protein 2 [Anopheles coustani]XP_058171175.1 amyloid protein-binding protein 2 [Anopheles ziemanni]